MNLYCLQGCKKKDGVKTTQRHKRRQPWELQEHEKWFDYIPIYLIDISETEFLQGTGLITNKNDI